MGEAGPAERPLGQKSALFALTLAPPLGVALWDPTLFFAALDNAGTYGGRDVAPLRAAASPLETRRIHPRSLPMLGTHLVFLPPSSSTSSSSSPLGLTLSITPWPHPPPPASLLPRPRRTCPRPPRALSVSTPGILVLFGIIPAAMAWQQRYSTQLDPADLIAPAALPGGRLSLAAMGVAAATVIGVETFERFQAVAMG